MPESAQVENLTGRPFLRLQLSHTLTLPGMPDTPMAVSPSPRDLGHLMEQLDAAVRVAAQVADAERADYLSSIGAAPSEEWSVAHFERIRMESPLELVLSLGGAFTSGALGLLALAKLLEHVFNTPVRIEAEREQLLTQAAKQRLKRMRIEQEYAELAPPPRNTRPQTGFQLLDGEIWWEDDAG
jgi:hypothetical protein